MWTSLALFNLDENWQLSNPITVNTFRLKHTWVNPYRYLPSAIAALARISNEGIEIYSPQKIYPRTELEIIQFPSPPLGWNYSLAVKQLIFNESGGKKRIPPHLDSNSIQWSLSVDMPLYPINPDVISPTSSTAFTSNTYQVTSTAAMKIAPSNPARKELSIFNADTKNNLYVDLVNTVTTSVAAFVIPPNQVYVSDLHWVGEVWAIAKGANISVVVREFT